jgi:hypothetical protein
MCRLTVTRRVWVMPGFDGIHVVYIRIFPRIQLPISAQWSQRLHKVQGKICIKSHFNQITHF